MLHIVKQATCQRTITPVLRRMKEKPARGALDNKLRNPEKFATAFFFGAKKLIEIPSAPA
jgi:hypothetical protein